MRPNLYIVGFQKCGSSSLFDFIASHPSIAASHPKETFVLVDSQSEHYSPEENIQNPSFSFDRYYEDAAKTAAYRLEGSVVNFYQKQAQQFIAASPDSKVVFILRDPIDRIKSNYRYYSDTGMVIGLKESMSQYLEKIKRQEYQKEALDYALPHGRYSKYISEWISLLGEERILVLELGELSKPNELSKKLAQFLQLEADLFVYTERANESSAVRFAVLNKFLVKYLSGVRQVLKTIPGAQKLFKQIITKPITTNDAPFSNDELKFLHKYYQEELAWLEQRKLSGGK